MVSNGHLAVAHGHPVVGSGCLVCANSWLLVLGGDKGRKKGKAARVTMNVHSKGTDHHMPAP